MLRLVILVCGCSEGLGAVCECNQGGDVRAHQAQYEVAEEVGLYSERGGLYQEGGDETGHHKLWKLWMARARDGNGFEALEALNRDNGSRLETN